MLGLGGLIHGEPCFYMHIRPGLEIETPTGYFGAVDSRSWRSIVVMEDVTSTRGASFWQPTIRSHGKCPRTCWPTWPSGTAHSETARGLLSGGGQRPLRIRMRVIDALIGIANRLPVGAERAHAVIPPPCNVARPISTPACGAARNSPAAGRAHTCMATAHRQPLSESKGQDGHRRLAGRASRVVGPRLHLPGGQRSRDREPPRLGARPPRLLPRASRRCRRPSDRAPQGLARLPPSHLLSVLRLVYTLGRSRLQPRFSLTRSASR